MRLTSALLEELGHLRAELKKKGEREKELTDEFKMEMVERAIDVFEPKGCPYMAVKTEYEQTDVSWKDVAETAYKELYGAKWKVMLSRTQKEYGTKHIVKLEVKPS